MHAPPNIVQTIQASNDIHFFSFASTPYPSLCSLYTLCIAPFGPSRTPRVKIDVMVMLIAIVQMVDWCDLGRCTNPNCFFKGSCCKFCSLTPLGEVNEQLLLLGFCVCACCGTEEAARARKEPRPKFDPANKEVLAPSIFDTPFHIDELDGPEGFILKVFHPDPIQTPENQTTCLKSFRLGLLRRKDGRVGSALDLIQGRRTLRSPPGALRPQFTSPPPPLRRKSEMNSLDTILCTVTTIFEMIFSPWDSSGQATSQPAPVVETVSTVGTPVPISEVSDIWCLDSSNLHLPPPKCGTESHSSREDNFNRRGRVSGSLLPQFRTFSCHPARSHGIFWWDFFWVPVPTLKALIQYPHKLLRRKVGGRLNRVGALRWGSDMLGASAGTATVDAGRLCGNLSPENEVKAVVGGSSLREFRAFWPRRRIWYQMPKGLTDEVITANPNPRITLPVIAPLFTLDDTPETGSTDEVGCRPPLVTEPVDAVVPEPEDVAETGCNMDVVEAGGNVHETSGPFTTKKGRDCTTMLMSVKLATMVYHPIGTFTEDHRKSSIDGVIGIGVSVSAMSSRLEGELRRGFVVKDAEMVSDNGGEP
ncbi:hypothetical protein C8F04DRAFT_1186751 [Mycena alexandri]|uniref:Uncharacterized protein n=1 Tax=Mycena alexandri TaxID=1745969 RepID=A0AAD6SRJ7_9AGAR|nr:hypothetical protein C8F04DRAFT_1186751 [Mycena alexandri]